VKILPFTASNIELISTQLAGNQAVILPTDTIYGLHLPYSDNNLQAINALKHRPADQPCIILYSHVSQITDILGKQDLRALEITSHIKGLSVIVNNHTPAGQAVRLISPKLQPTLSLLLDQTGPLFSSSANVSGETYLHSPEHISRSFNLPTYVSPMNTINVSRETLPSTIIDVRTRPWQLVRSGAADIKDIKGHMSV
jgi:L-threonylcarbamoyladenylate synthase